MGLAELGPSCGCSPPALDAATLTALASPPSDLPEELQALFTSLHQQVSTAIDD